MFKPHPGPCCTKWNLIGRTGRIRIFLISPNLAPSRRRFFFFVKSSASKTGSAESPGSPADVGEFFYCAQYKQHEHTSTRRRRRQGGGEGGRFSKINFSSGNILKTVLRTARTPRWKSIVAAVDRFLFPWTPEFVRSENY